MSSWNFREIISFSISKLTTVSTFVSGVSHLLSNDFLPGQPCSARYPLPTFENSKLGFATSSSCCWKNEMSIVDFVDFLPGQPYNARYPFPTFENSKLGFATSSSRCWKWNECYWFLSIFFQDSLQFEIFFQNSPALRDTHYQLLKIQSLALRLPLLATEKWNECCWFLSIFFQDRPAMRDTHCQLLKIQSLALRLPLPAAEKMKWVLFIVVAFLDSPALRDTHCQLLKIQSLALRLQT